MFSGMQPAILSELFCILGAEGCVLRWAEGGEYTNQKIKNKRNEQKILLAGIVRRIMSFAELCSFDFVGMVPWPCPGEAL